MHDRDAADYAYQRRNPPGGSQAVLEAALAKDSRRRTTKEIRAVALLREEQKARDEEAVAAAMATFRSDHAISRATGLTRPYVKKLRLQIEQRIAERSDGSKKAMLVNACEAHLRVFATAAMQGDPAASREARAWADMLARLDGSYARPESDAAARVEIDVTVIEATVAQMVAQNESEAKALEAQIITLPASHPAAI